MRTELVTEPGDPGRPNEDFATIGLPASGQGGSLVLLDGVTPPRDATGCLHSVPWFTARLGGALTELSVSQRDMPLTEVLAAALTRTAGAHAQTCDLSHPRTPQATVVLARWSPETVEHLVLSDSALLTESPDGTVTAHLDDRLSRVPRSSLATDAIADATVRNKEGGFFTAAADPSVAFRAVTGTTPRAEVRPGRPDGRGDTLGGEVRRGRLDGLLHHRPQGGRGGAGASRTGAGAGGRGRGPATPAPQQDTRRRDGRVRRAVTPGDPVGPTSPSRGSADAAAGPVRPPRRGPRRPADAHNGPGAPPGRYGSGRGPRP